MAGDLHPKIPVITIRRAEERQHDQGRQRAVWLTFYPEERPGDLGNGFGALEILDEFHLAPGGAAPSHPRHDAEIVTFVREGALAWEDSNGGSGIVQAGEFRRMTAGRGIRHREANASRIHGAHIFQIWLRPARAELEPSHEQRRFSAAERRGRLCVVGSPDGRRASLSIHQDALVFSALLDPGTHVAHELLPGRSAWLHVVLGEASLFGEVVLGAGDGGGITSESVVSLTALKETEILLLDLGPQREETVALTRGLAVENALLLEQMRAATLHMKALSRRLVETRENERRHISRELHDEAGQALVSLRHGLRLLEREIDEGKCTNGRVAELVQQTDAVIEGLHRLAADLRPASLDHLGLEAALRQYLRSAGANFDLTVRFKARGFGGDRLPAPVETALYRVVQEAMTNVVRHAHATRIDVLAERDGERVLVMVEDDGIGFDPEEVRGQEHLGLLGLRERAETLGGTLTLESAPGTGTTVVVEVPIVDSHLDR